MSVSETVADYLARCKRFGKRLTSQRRCIHKQLSTWTQSVGTLCRLVHQAAGKGCAALSLATSTRTVFDRPSYARMAQLDGVERNSAAGCVKKSTAHGLVAAEPRPTSLAEGSYFKAQCVLHVRMDVNLHQLAPAGTHHEFNMLGTHIVVTPLTAVAPKGRQSSPTLCCLTLTFITESKRKECASAGAATRANLQLAWSGEEWSLSSGFWLQLRTRRDTNCLH